jgi:hypothetical protein
MIHSLIVLVVYLIIVGVILWLLRYLVGALPLDPPFAQVANVVILVVGPHHLVLLLSFAG